MMFIVVVEQVSGDVGGGVPGGRAVSDSSC